jgi:MFS family permease
LYFIGQAISLSGSWMQTVALGWLVLELTGSGTALGFVTAAQFLPVLFFGPWGGVVVDRLDKRRLLYVTQAAFGLLAAGVWVLLAADAMEPWMLYVFALSLGVVRIFDNPARQTFVAEMVPASELKNAVSLNATENNLARAVGPSIAGAIIATSGTAFCFLANGLSYIAVIWMLAAMRDEEFYERTRTKRRRGQLRAGFQYVRRTRLIRNILVMMAIVGTFAYEFQVSLPILARETFGAGAEGYASLLAAFGAGAVAGGLYAASRTRTSEQQFIVNLALFGAAMVATALAPTLSLAIMGMLAVGALSINVTALGNTMVQLAAEPAMRGRVMALWTVAMIGSTPIGGPFIGMIGEYAGGRMGLAAGGLAALLTALVAVHFLKRRERMRDISAEVHVSSQTARIGSMKA